jgi:PKD repeat protein
VTSVCDGETVTFTNQSTGTTGSTTYSWDFGTGASPATATGEGPHTVTYSGSGLRTVSLEINDGTTLMETKSDYITVNTIPSITDVSTVNPTGCDLADGEIVITATGSGTLVYSIDGIDWTDTTGTFTGLDTGVYSIAVRGQTSGCEATDTDVQLTCTPQSSDARLSSLTVDGGTLGPAYNPDSTTYSVELEPGTTEMPTIHAETTDPNATVNIDHATNLYGTETERTATIEVTAEDGTTMTYTLIYDIVKYRLTTEVSQSGYGTIALDTVTSDSLYEYGTVVTATAEPADGYEFDKWEGASTDTSVSATITMDSNKLLRAVFEAAPVEKYKLMTFVVNGEIIEVSPNKMPYDAGTEVTITAKPNDSGYVLTGWTGDTANAVYANENGENKITIVMDADKVVTCNYRSNVGIGDMFAHQKAIIYPNPLMEGEAYLELAGYRQGENIDVSIYSVLGELLDQKQVEIESAQSTVLTLLHHKFNKEGLYIIQINGENGQKNLRLIVQ